MGRLASLAARLRGERGGINVTIGSASATVLAVVAIAAGAMVVPTVTGGSNSLSCTGASVTTGTFSSRVSGAAAGDTLCLSAGSYGAWTPAMSKSAPGVTIAPVSGASVTFGQVDVQSSAGFTMDGSSGTLTVAAVDGMPQNPTASRWTFTHLSIAGYVSFAVCGSNVSQILFDHDDFPSFNATDKEGRFQFAGTGTGTCGVTIQNSTLDGGCSDGIQTGTHGVRVLNNEFRNYIQGSCAPHVDSMQLFGGSDMVIQGNWIHDASTGIMNYDGGNSNNLIEDNVIGPNVDGDGGCVLLTTGDDTQQIIHNTVLNGDICTGQDHSGTPDTNVTMKDNIVNGGTATDVSGGTTYLVNDYNLCSTACGGASLGAHNITGSATFTGGTTPTSYAGFHLTTGSLGHLAADDGLDMGIR